MPAREAALELARRLQAAGHEALFAGGCVRDRLLGHVPKDYDIATSALPAQVLKLVPGSHEVGAHFGVVIAKPGGHHVEIATFRTDGSYRDGRRPESVTFSTPMEDAQRRDFTINGLFEQPATGEVIDFVSGLGHSPNRSAGRGPQYCITNLGQFDYAQGRMRLTWVHPGQSIEKIQAKTGFELAVAPDVRETEPPTAEEVRLLREAIDPLGVRKLETLSGALRKELIREILRREA
jgi:hypothetical protein